MSSQVGTGTLPSCLHFPYLKTRYRAAITEDITDKAGGTRQWIFMSQKQTKTKLLKNELRGTTGETTPSTMREKCQSKGPSPTPGKLGTNTERLRSEGGLTP